MSKVASLPARLPPDSRREGHGDDLFVAGLDADELVFRSPDETVGADDEFSVFVLATVEGNAINLAEVIHGDAVALGGLALLVS